MPPDTAIKHDPLTPRVRYDRPFQDTRDACIICRERRGTVRIVDGLVCGFCMPRDLLPEASSLKMHRIVMYCRTHPQWEPCEASAAPDALPREDRSRAITIGSGSVLADELNRCIRGADSIDIVVSFIKSSGLNLLIDELRAFSRRGRIRVITTAYMGATEYEALDELFSLPDAEVRMELRADSTRLHAKAFLFNGNDGDGVAFVGSANISKSALTGGEEWVVELREEEVPQVVSDLQRGFEALWNSGHVRPVGKADRATIEMALERRGMRFMSMELELAFSQRVGYSMYLNEMDLLLTAKARNDGDGIGNVVFRFRSSPEFFPEVSVPLQWVGPDETVDISTLRSSPIEPDPDYISSITERTPAVVTLEALDAEGNVLASASQTTHILPFNYWPGGDMPEILASFVTPNAPSLAAVRSRASDKLASWKQNPSLEGYQSGSADRALALGAAVYAALEELNINYVNPPAGFESEGQRIRLPDEALSLREGTCIDLAALYAAALESIGLNPVVFIVRGHAFAGFWLYDTWQPDIVSWDSSEFTRMIRNKAFRAVECTMFTNGFVRPFEDACAQALLRLEDMDHFICAVDVRAARGTILPMPVRMNGDGGWEIGRRERSSATGAPGSLGEIYSLPDAAERQLTRVDKWKRELLDITSRNNMVSMKQGTKVMPLLVSSVSELEDHLADGREFTLLPKPQDWNGAAAYGERPFETENYAGNYAQSEAADLSIRRIRTPMTESDTEKSLRSIYRLSKKMLDETGCNSLFMAIGVLRWFEGKSTGVARYAPLILVPAEMKKKQNGYTVKKLDEDTVFNVTLAEKLRQEFEVTIPGIDPLPTDGSGVNVDRVLQTVRACIAGKEGWEVLQGAALGVFSFSQFAMWKDLEDHMDAYSESPLVKSLVDGTPYPAEKDLSCSSDPYGLCLTVPADGSQIRAVRASGEGRTFVMHGPPGTGKSQTITNMITNALYQGKTVLFVAEKRAALEVVQKRLEEVGIGNRCLELHSNKTEKSRIIEQLGRALERSPACDGAAADELLKRIEQSKEHLDGYVSDLHKVRGFGISAYEAISRYGAHNVEGVKLMAVSLRGRVPLCESNIADAEMTMRSAAQARGFVAGADADVLRHVRCCVPVGSMQSDAASMIQRLRERAADAAGKDARLRSLGLPGDDAASIRKTAEDLLSIDARVASDAHIGEMCQLSKIADLAESLSDDLGVFSRSDVMTVLREKGAAAGKCSELARLAAEAASLGHLPRPSHIQRLASECGRYFEALSKMERDLVAINAHWNLGVFDLNSRYDVSKEWIAANNAGIFSKGKARKAFMDAVSPNLRDPNLRFEDLSSTVNLVRDCAASFEDVRDIPSRYGRYNQDIDGEVALLRRMSKAAARAVEIAEAHGIPPASIPALRELAAGASSALSESEEAHRALDASIADLRGLLDLDDESSSEEGILHYCDLLETQLHMLFDWVNWNYYADRLRGYGLGCAVDSIEEGMDTDLMVHSAIRSVYMAVINECRAESEILRMFSSENFEGMVDKFRQMDANYSALNRNLLRYRLSSNIPSNMDTATSSSEAGVLYKAVHSSRLRMSIRQLIASIPNILPKVCPCFLMSPQSVPQYITADFPRFDLVIFDESSQITTSKAIGALGRAENAVIAGDSKQLPPTTFFQKKMEDEEDEASIDVDSFLDDCLSLNMPETYLEWHYRSRHESLIAFSNRTFYDGKMLTFPSPNDLETKVSMRFVKGVYERNKRCNPIEARAIVNEVRRRVLDPELSKQSIGIVAFSISQQECIMDLLDDLVKSDKALFNGLSAMPEEMFIKNLETVQGDERDVILFSIGYGPGRDGTVLQNFGPINRDGGGRRLNVAVSRARMEMVVFTSMKYTDVKLTPTSKAGVRSLREFLLFAENHGRFQDPDGGAERSGGTQILLEIAKTLQGYGYKTHFDVGTSSFKVDIAVLDKSNPSRYVLGILTDGESYRSSENTRDREFARADVLTRLGWNLIHIWSLDWYFRKGAVTIALLKALSAAEAGAPREEAPCAADESAGLVEEEEQVPEEAPEPAGRRADYMPYEIVPAMAYSANPDTDRDLIGRVTAPVLEHEAPVTESYLVRVFCKSVGISRLSEARRTNITAYLRYMYDPDIRGSFVTYWAPGAERTMETYRVSDDPELNRDIDSIPLVEILNACRDEVERSFSIPLEDAPVAISRTLGFGRTGARIRTVMAEALDIAVEDGIVEVSDGRLTVPR